MEVSEHEAPSLQQNAQLDASATAIYECNVSVYPLQRNISGSIARGRKTALPLLLLHWNAYRLRGQATQSHLPAKNWVT